MSVVPLRFSKTEELSFELPKSEPSKLETTKIEVVPIPESAGNENHVGVHVETQEPEPVHQNDQKKEPVPQVTEQEPEVLNEEPEVHSEKVEVHTEIVDVHTDDTEVKETEAESKETEETKSESVEVVSKEETSEVESSKPPDEDKGSTPEQEKDKVKPHPSQSEFEEVDLSSDKTQLVLNEDSKDEKSQQDEIKAQSLRAEPNKNEVKSGAQVNPAFELDEHEVKPEINGNKPCSVIDLDGVLPAESLWTTVGREAVKLRMTESGPGSVAPRSVPSILLQTVRRVPGRIALAKKVNGEWKKWTYKQYYLDVRTAAKGFIKLGLQPAHGVGILGFNSPEWFISDIGAIFAGGWAVGIYTTNSPEACQYVAENCEANVIVVENTAQLKKILAIRDNLPHLKAVVQYDGKPEEAIPGFLYSWDEFMELGKTVPDLELEERLALIAPNKCCTLIYTSGTTGNPKGVMLSHDNITWTAKQNTSYASLKFASEVLVSYLPLSHIAAQILDIHMPMVEAGTVYFAQPDALKGSLGATLKEVRPTSFLGVPRVWEKIMEKMQVLGKQTTGLKKKIANWAKGIGLKGNYSKMRGGSTPFGWTIANFLVFRKVQAALGLDRCHICMSGAAPISKETLEYFLSLNIVVNEVYGMSESTGPHTLNIPGKNRMQSAGLDFPGATTKLREPDEEGNGEICMYGRHVFMGYLNNEEKTKETLDEEAYLMTGDIGRKDKDGFLFITGRIKELIITAGGENVAPVPIEDNVKAELPVVSNCMLIGDKKKFLSLFITLKTEVDPETTAPLDKLTQQAKWWCEEQGSDVTTVSEILEQKPEVIYKAIQAGIDRANAKSVSRAQKIQKFYILPGDFSIPGGELGPSLKLKRPVVSKMYSQVVEELYAET